jgi:hypothetical protein
VRTDNGGEYTSKEFVAFCKSTGVRRELTVKALMNDQGLFMYLWGEAAMTEEHQSIMKNDVWEIVPRPKEKSVVTSKWVYKIKNAADGSVDKYKQGS